MAQLRTVLPELVDRGVPVGLAALDERLGAWLSKAAEAATVEEGAEVTLLPSVHCGLEMAVVHLVARGLGVSIGAAVSVASGSPCRGSIEINGLQTREEGASGREVYTIRSYRDRR